MTGSEITKSMILTNHRRSDGSKNCRRVRRKDPEGGTLVAHGKRLAVSEKKGVNRFDFDHIPVPLELGN